MAFRFKSTDRSIESGVRRIAREQIAKACATVEAVDNDPAPAIHDVRKRCKKLRGLVRLVRPSFAGYARENDAFRRIAALFGDLRDARVIEDTLDGLAAAYEAQLDAGALAPIRDRLAEARTAKAVQADVGDRFVEARTLLHEARDRAEAWHLDADGWDAVEDGLAKTCDRTRKARRTAAKSPTGVHHHEWRKRVKYHWYHARLLREIWPDQLMLRAEHAHRLTRTLGDHHDLYVLEERLAADPQAFGPADGVASAIGLARRRRAMLEEEAHRLGSRLFAEPADALADNWGRWWSAWQREGPVAEAALSR